MPLAAMLAAVVAAAAVGATGAGCGGNDVGPQSRLVGGRCAVDNDCDRRCQTEAEYPGGYCTVGCLDDGDCPGGSVCIARSGGVCLAVCRGSPQDCDPFGVGYQCNREARQGGGERALVCIGG